MSIESDFQELNVLKKVVPFDILTLGAFFRLVLTPPFDTLSPFEAIAFLKDFYNGALDKPISCYAIFS